VCATKRVFPAGFLVLVGIVACMRAVPPDAGPIGTWTDLWAIESAKAAASAYRGITYVPAGPRRWRAEFADRKAFLAAPHQEKERRVIEAAAGAYRRQFGHDGIKRK
jgi:hypothetical protein